MSKSRLIFSIIVPVKKMSEDLRNCIAHCLKLAYSSFEVIVLPDNNINLQDDRRRVKVIPTGPTSPAEKRNVGIKEARGVFLAFIDDDAYPDKNWLRNTEKYFEDEDVAAVGGPNLTPESDELSRKASGFVLGCFVGGGPLSYEYSETSVKRAMKVKTQSSCNLIVRKSVMNKIGGFTVTYWPGEDTKLCGDIVKIGKKIIYAPDVIIYHHRRPLFREHLRQISNYALHRGFFVKRFKETSLSLTYFLPSIFVLFVFFGFLLSFLSDIVRLPYLTVLSIYLLLVLFEASRKAIETRNLKLGAWVFFGITLTHFTYGLSFLKGLAKRQLNR